MSKSGQAFVAATQGSSRTMYAVIRMMGLPLSEEQEKLQRYLEMKYPPVIEGGEDDSLHGCQQERALCSG